MNQITIRQVVTTGEDGGKVVATAEVKKEAKNKCTLYTIGYTYFEK